MKFNKAEMGVLASQPGYRFDREGVLFVKERQEGFFRRNEICLERWCRLRGNLLFYFKSRDQWSEPAGVIVLENVTVDTDTDCDRATYGLTLSWGAGQYTQYLGCHTHVEREGWRAAIAAASHATMRRQLESLYSRLREIRAVIAEPGGAAQLANSNSSSSSFPDIKLSVIDPDTPAILESSFSCDNLLCDAIGRTPSTRLVVSLRNSETRPWEHYSNTEVVERTSNPVFMVTLCFRASDGVLPSTQVRVRAEDLRERLTKIRTLLGQTVTTISELQKTERLRLPLASANPEGRGAGFVTITSWTPETEPDPSAGSTPTHILYNPPPPALPAQPMGTADGGVNGATEPPAVGEERNQQRSVAAAAKHRRSHSLPPSMSHKIKVPRNPFLLLLYSAPLVKTYRFHSGLGGDIAVMELMAEPRLSFTFPQQLLSLWIAEEKELVHEIAGLGELREPWHSCQMRWLENHLNLINIYATALENLENYRGPNFRKSSMKEDRTYEFVPTNLHLQRLWVQSDSLRKSGFFDIHTVGAFTALAQKTKSEGLIRMLKELKSPQKDSSAWCSLSDRLLMAEDSLSAVRKVRREVVDCMRLLMKLARERVSQGMFQIVEEMLKKTKLLCSISDTTLVEEALTFLEKNRVSVRPEKDDFSDSVAEFMQRNRLKIDLQFRPNFGSLQTPNTEFICKELGTPDPEYFSPSLDPSRGEYWRGYSAFTSGYQSVDRLSDIDEFEESFRYMSIEDRTRHYYTLCRNATPHDTPSATPLTTPKHQGAKEGEGESKKSIVSGEEGKTENLHSENDSALEDDSGEDDEASEDQEDGYQYDEYDHHPEDDDQDVTNGEDYEEDENKVEDEEEEEEEDDESTPQVVSETSKTQSPSSVGHVVISELESENGTAEIAGAAGTTAGTESSSHGAESSTMGEGSVSEDQCVIKENSGYSGDDDGGGSVSAPADAVGGDVASNETGAGAAKATDNGIVCDSESSSHYRSGEEPEPIDLTHLNIEASMMCLASRVRTICGRANSPTLSNRTFRFRELDSMKKQQNQQQLQLPGRMAAGTTTVQDERNGDSEDPAGENQQQQQNQAGFKIPDVPKPSTEEIEDWASEVRPSMRKLRQGMDSLLKTSRLLCSVLRLQQLQEAVTLTHNIKYRRDVCFSQALTSLVSSLMGRLWCQPPDLGFLALLTTIGPLVAFEGLLSLYGPEVAMLNDMIVAVEDLRSVEFALILVERKTKGMKQQLRKGAGQSAPPHSASGAVPVVTCSVSSFPLPRVTGSRNSLKVLLPVPDWVYSHTPLNTLKAQTFNVTPVFFNIGINEKATLAEKLGLTQAQEKNNLDNFRILSDYVRRYKKLGLFDQQATAAAGSGNRRGQSLPRGGCEAHVSDLMAIMRSEVSSHRSKNTDILHLSSQICGKLNGIRFTSCKSGKDRTGMSATLEQVNTLSREFDLADSEYQRALDTFRSEGVRIRNCGKNIGEEKFAFHTLQLQTFPKQLRPPLGTFGAMQT